VGEDVNYLTYLLTGIINYRLARITHATAVFAHTSVVLLFLIAVVFLFDKLTSVFPLHLPTAFIRNVEVPIYNSNSIVTSARIVQNSWGGGRVESRRRLNGSTRAVCGVGT